MKLCHSKPDVELLNGPQGIIPSTSLFGSSAELHGERNFTNDVKFSNHFNLMPKAFGENA